VYDVFGGNDSSVNASRRKLLKASATGAGVIAGGSTSVSADSSVDIESASELASSIQKHASGVLSYLEYNGVLDDFDVVVPSLTREKWVAANRKGMHSFEGQHGVVATKRSSREGLVTHIQATLTNEGQSGELVVVPDREQAYFIKQSTEPKSVIDVREGVRKSQREFRFIADEEEVSSMVAAQRQKEGDTERIGTQEARIQGCIISICTAGIEGPGSGTCVLKEVYCPACTMTIGGGCGYDCEFNAACTPYNDPCETYNC
jgi:hypothetical protein